jgi:hypothetical protein
MHTEPMLTKDQYTVYHEYIQSDHDFLVWVEVLTLMEKQVGIVEFMDGQVNFSPGDEGPDRTASLIVSDPEGALNYNVAYAEDDQGVLWVNRLLRAKHAVTVPDLGYLTVVSTPFIGVPTSIANKGGELSFECGDKSLLADHGVRPRTYKKGANVRNVLISILRDLTGEFKFRIPTTNKRLSRTYTVGMGDDATTPWNMFKRIAGSEMGWRSYYSCDGFATCEPTSTVKPIVQVNSLLTLPQSSTSFTDFSNYAKTTSHRKPKNRKGKQDDKRVAATTITYESVATLKPGHRLSEQSLERNKVPRTLPIVISDDDLKTMRDVSRRSQQELETQSRLGSEQAFEIVPFHHMDTADRFGLPLGIGNVTFAACSIPLGTNGNMTLGQNKWVSTSVGTIRTRNKTTVKRKKQKGGKKHGK